jgi:hypothetical protein
MSGDSALLFFLVLVAVLVIAALRTPTRKGKP